METIGPFSPSINSSVAEALASDGDLIKKLDFLFTNDTGLITHTIVLTEQYAVLIDFESSRDVPLVPVGERYLKMHEFFPFTGFGKFGISKVEDGRTFNWNTGDGAERVFQIDYTLNTDAEKLYSTIMEQLPFLNEKLNMGPKEKELKGIGYSDTKPIWGVAKVSRNGNLCELLGAYLTNHPNDIQLDSEATSVSHTAALLNQVLHDSAKDLSKMEIIAYSSIVDRFIGESISIPRVFFNKNDGFLQDPFFLTLSKKVSKEMGLIGDFSYTVFRDDENLFISMFQSMNKKQAGAYTIKLPFDSITNSSGKITTKKISVGLKKHMAISRNEKGISQSSFSSRYAEEGMNNSRVILGLRLAMKGGEAIGAISEKNQWKIKWHHKETVILSKIIPLLLNLCIARFEPNLSRELHPTKSNGKKSRSSRKGRGTSRKWDWGTDSIRYIKAKNPGNKMSRHWVSPFVRQIPIKREKTIQNYRRKGWPVIEIDGKHIGARMIMGHHRGKGKASNWDGTYRFGKSPSYYSAAAIRWLKSIEQKEGITIQHAERRGDEKRLENGDSFIKVDGYCEENNTVYEFHGDFWHGNPSKYDPNDINPKSKKTFGDLYELTKLKESCIEELGYNLVVMWESDWDEAS